VALKAKKVLVLVAPPSRSGRERGLKVSLCVCVCVCVRVSVRVRLWLLQQWKGVVVKDARARTADAVAGAGARLVAPDLFGKVGVPAVVRTVQTRIRCVQVTPHPNHQNTRIHLIPARPQPDSLSHLSLPGGPHRERLANWQ
jgi:hypothetical protein